MKCMCLEHCTSKHDLWILVLSLIGQIGVQDSALIRVYWTTERHWGNSVISQLKCSPITDFSAPRASSQFFFYHRYFLNQSLRSKVATILSIQLHSTNWKQPIHIATLMPCCSNVRGAREERWLLELISFWKPSGE